MGWLGSKMFKIPATGILCLGILATSGAENRPDQQSAKPPAVPRGMRGSAPNTADAKRFIDAAEGRLLDLQIKSSRASWVQQNFITDDTDQISAEANQVLDAATTELAAEATRFKGMPLPEDITRKLLLLRLSSDFPAPRNPAEQKELATLGTSLVSDYGKGKWCPEGAPGKCLDLTAMERILATSRDPAELQRVWLGWHSIGAPMRKRYERFVELGNKGSREMGFSDAGALWRSKYDMPPEAFAKEVDRLWMQVRPLYEALHAYVRAQLAKKYGNDVAPENDAIPAHLLGNMWSQDWVNVYPLLTAPEGQRAYELTEILRGRNTDARKMVQFGEHFFTSLGFAALPETFWARSLFTKPADRDVVRHASAWSIDFNDDLRIKMCIQITDEDFGTIHHELGHNFYQRAYNQQSVLFQNSANDGFHEAVGDTIALSVTPEYLKQIGLIETVPPPSGDIGFLLKKALEKIAFLPFGLLVDKWRWGVFSGEIKPVEYNKAWWQLRRQYQGIAPPVARDEAGFDPGAKYHVPANVPYMRYFLADILQFQFHRALCKEAGVTGPLHRCSIYNSKAAGARLNKMLEMGQSRPWPEALAAISGEKQMDASAILDYFAPLKTWLDEQNKGHRSGW